MLAVAVMIVMAAAVPVSADGSTGSITITNATAGTTYTAYKIFSATANGNAVAYTTDETGKLVIEGDSNAPFTVDAKYNVERKETASDAEIIAWLSNHYNEFDSTGTSGGGATESTYTISNLALGYYYISAGNGSAISIDTYTGTDKSLAVKNTEGPNTPTKKITAEDGTNISDGKTENSADVGSTETFSVTYNATNYANKTVDGTTTATKIENFYIKDTPTGLDIQESTVEVLVKGQKISNFTKEITDGSLKITIPWVDTNGESIYTPEDTNNLNYGNIPVTVTYNATVTEDAAIDVAENEVHIYYNHNTVTETEVTNVDIPKTQTYTYKFQLNKTDGKDLLAGAQFELSDSNGNTVTFIENGAKYRVAKTGETGTTTTIDMTTNTTVEILGLDNNTYTLTETKAPDGYTLASDTIIFAADSNETGNKLVRVDGTYGNNGGDAGNVTVVNRVGSLLPSTGGIGTTIFYVLGALLIIGAGVVLIARRRMNSNQ